MLRRFNAMRRFFLERMDHPEVFADLHSVDHPERIAPKGQRDFKHARSKTLHRLGYSRLATLGGNAQCVENDLARAFRKVLESLSRRSEPGYRPGSPHFYLSPYLSDVGRITNIC